MTEPDTRSTVDTSTARWPLFLRAAVTGRRRIGSVLPARTMTASGVTSTLGRLVDYQRLCGFDVSEVLPAPFVHVQAFPLQVSLLASTDFPMPLLGLIHIENTMTQYRPVTLGERLDLTVHAADLRPHESGRQVDLVSSASVAGETVWAGRSTYLQRTGRPDRSATRQRSAPPTTDAVWRLPADLGRRYAAVSGDRNPIHLSRLSARAFGFPRAIAHGMWTAARAQASLGALVPGACRIDVSFRAPVVLPSTVGVHTARTEDAWAVSVFGARSGKPHLTLTVGPVPARVRVQ